MLSNGFLSRVLVTQDIETLVLVVLKDMKPCAWARDFSCRPSIVPKRRWEVLHAIVDSI